MQELPKSIRVPGKMVAGLCGANTRINADKEHKHVGLDAIAKLSVLSSRVDHIILGQFSKDSTILPQI